MRLTQIEDAALKTHAYLTLEVLFAARRFDQALDHTESMLKMLIDNSEVLSVFKHGQGGSNDE